MSSRFIQIGSKFINTSMIKQCHVLKKKNLIRLDNYTLRIEWNHNKFSGNFFWLNSDDSNYTDYEFATKTSAVEVLYNIVNKDTVSDKYNLQEIRNTVSE